MHVGVRLAAQEFNSSYIGLCIETKTFSMHTDSFFFQEFWMDFKLKVGKLYLQKYYRTIAAVIACITMSSIDFSFAS